MTEEVVLQFTPSEQSGYIRPSGHVESSDISSIGTNSYMIDLTEETKIIVLFDRQIRYTTEIELPNLSELLSDAEKAVHQYLKTSANHFDLQIILNGEQSELFPEYTDRIEEVRNERHLDEYTIQSLSTGRTLVSFTGCNNSIFV